MSKKLKSASSQHVVIKMKAVALAKKPRVLLHAEPEVSFEEEEEEEEVVVEKKTKKTTPKKTKKRKESSEEEEEEQKTKRVRTEKVLGNEEATKLLKMLAIDCDEKTLKVLEKNDKKRYDKLIALLEPLTVFFSERTPVGRIFTYSSDIGGGGGDDDTGFTVIRDSPRVFKIMGYEKRQDLNARALFDALDEEKQDSVLHLLGKSKESMPNDAQLLYGLIASQNLKRVVPDHSDPCQKCVLHDETRKETHWLATKEAKAKLGPVFVLKLKKRVTAENIIDEINKLRERRDDMVRLLTAVLDDKSPKKKKKSVPVAEPKEKKKKSVSIVEPESPKKRKKEAEEAVATPEPLPAKKKARTTPTKSVSIEVEPGLVLKPLSTPIKNGDITINKIERTVAHDHGFTEPQTAAQLRDKVSKSKLKLMALDKELDPRIQWFNEHCGTA